MPASADNRSFPPNRAPTTVARSPAFPRGLEQDEAFGDLSILGYPMPTATPGYRAPDRLADRPDEWGYISELGPIATSELFSVGNWPERQGRLPPDVPQDAAGPSEPVAHAPAAIASMSQQEQVPPPVLPHARTPQARIAALRDIETQFTQLHREDLSLFALDSDESDLDQLGAGAPSHDDFLAAIRRGQRRSLEAERAERDERAEVRARARGEAHARERADARARERDESRARELLRERQRERAEVLRAERALVLARAQEFAALRATEQAANGPIPLNARPQNGTRPDTVGRQTGFAGAASQTTQVVMARPAPATSAQSPPSLPDLGTAVPQGERGGLYNTVRNWRDGIAQQTQLPPSTPWDVQPHSAAAESSQAARHDAAPSFFGGPSSTFRETVPNRARGLWPPSGRDSAPSDVPVLSNPEPRLSTFRPTNRPGSPTRLHATWAQVRAGASQPSEQDQTSAALTPARAPAVHVPSARRRAFQEARLARRQADLEAFWRESAEPEADVAGAPPSAGLRPLLLTGHAPFRAGPHWDESGRPSNHQGEASGMGETPPGAVPSTSSSARATSGGAPAGIQNEVPRVFNPQHLRRDPGVIPSYYDFGGTAGTTSTSGPSYNPGYLYNGPYMAYYGYRAHSSLTTSANAARADGGDPVDLSDRSPRRAGTQANHTQLAAGSSAAAQQADRPAPAPMHMRSRPHLGGAYSMHMHDDLYNQLAANAVDHDQRAIRLLACALASADPVAFIAHKINSTQNANSTRNVNGNLDDYRFSPKMDPDTRLKLFTRLTRATQMFPVQARRKFITNVLTRSRWEHASIEGDKDECCSICQEDVSVHASPRHHR